MTAAQFSDGHEPGDLAQKTARGALTSVVGQAANFALRILSMVVIARLVTPEHFGLVGMVTAFTGLLGLFRDAGLSAASVQRETVTEELLSALFWINLAVGIGLALLMVAAAPLLTAFYGEPRLLWITIGLATSFIFNGASAQHRALLQRRMRFGVLTVIDISALVVSIGLSVGVALAGFGYWALVAMAVSQPMLAFVGQWLATGWIPGPPRHALGLGSMMRYGGVITLNSLVMYIAYNADKVLLGRFYGAEVLGAYGRAYQLVSLPTDNLHTTLSWVMFPALSRVQKEPARLRSFFLKGYGLFLAVATPITVACGLFAHEIVAVFLGPQWGSAVPVFQLLAPTILAYSLINPLGTMMQACGHAMRSLKLAFVIAPVVLLGYALGLAHGPEGVALGFSTAMLLLVAPAMYWAIQGTLISVRDVVGAVLAPAVSTLVGAAAAMAVAQVLPTMHPLLRLTTLSTILFTTHVVVLAFLPGQRELLATVFHRLRGPRATAATEGTSS
jgi:O-antigen/teichoic acid export membrane protein